MPRYVAFLRGVSPMNLRMSALKDCMEKVGFKEVKTVISSGNVAFDSPRRSTSTIEREIESALGKYVGRSFFTIVRSVAVLEQIIQDNPYADFDLPADAKRVVTFARKLPRLEQSLPITRGGARIFSVRDGAAFSAYVPDPKGPVFMELIESTFGKDVTTRTFETVKKCARA